MADLGVNLILGGVTLTDVESIREDKNANILPLTMPGSDSEETEVFDMLGVTRMIDIQGMFAGTGAEIQTSIDAIEALITGLQIPITYTDQNGTSITVMIMAISTSWNLPGSSCNYGIKLIQGTNSEA